MDDDRIKHSLAVARKMKEIAKSMNLTEKEIEDCFIVGYNHDIGYEFTKNGKEHNIVGCLILKARGFKYWKEIYYHSETEYLLRFFILKYFKSVKYAN